MTKSFYFFLCLVVLGGGILQGHANEKPQNGNPDFRRDGRKGLNVSKYEKYINQVIKKFAQELESKFGFEPFAQRKSETRIEVFFNANRRASFEEAREIEVKMVDRFLEMINSSKGLKSFLKEFPFTPKNVSVQIGFLNEYQQPYSDGTVAFVSTKEGDIRYSAYDPIENSLIELGKEPYEEAKKYVEKHSLKYDLALHLPALYEKKVDKFFRDFAREIKGKWSLTCENEGGKMVNGIEEFAFNFTAQKRASLEEARKLEVEITERLVESINSHKGLRPYLKEYPFKPERAKVVIAFQKPDDTYYKEGGGVATVKQENNEVSYTAFALCYNVQPKALNEEDSASQNQSEVIPSDKQSRIAIEISTSPKNLAEKLAAGTAEIIGYSLFHFYKESYEKAKQLAFPPVKE